MAARGRMAAAAARLGAAALASGIGLVLAGPALAQASADGSLMRPLPHALSPLAMIRNADIVVQGVMAGLAVAALATLTILLAKSAELLLARHVLRRGLARLEVTTTLELARRQAAGRRDPASLMILAAGEETEATGNAVSLAAPDGLRGRISSALSRIEIHSAARLARGTGVLATIGSVGPFVGLFGTVWGIMNAFIGISEAQTTSLAVVAPGIAEALLATAIGLVAAIPAVIVYNGLQRANAGYRRLLGDAASAVERLAGRDLDRRLALAADQAMSRGKAA